MCFLRSLKMDKEITNICYYQNTKRWEWILEIKLIHSLVIELRKTLFNSTKTQANHRPIRNYCITNSPMNPRPSLPRRGICGRKINMHITSGWGKRSQDYPTHRQRRQTTIFWHLDSSSTPWSHPNRVWWCDRHNVRSHFSIIVVRDSVSAWPY